MTFTVTPTGGACGAIVENINLTQALDADTVAALRAAWLEHHLLVFPKQPLSDDDLLRFTLYFGEIGADPYLGTMDDNTPIVELSRLADETAPIFAENWHSDWSFLPVPPAVILPTTMIGIGLL